MLRDLLINAIRFVRNCLRLWGRRAPDYVLLELQGPLPERATARRSFLQRFLPFGPAPYSIEEFNRDLELIAGTPRVKGVVLRIGEIGAPLARLQNLRVAIQRFRQRGKRVVAQANILDMRRYLVACAADEIVAPEGADFTVRGLSRAAYYLKDALAEYGVEVEGEAAGEYKSAIDQLRRSSMSEPEREMLNALLDATFEDVVSAIAADRRLSAERVRELIDEASIPALQAREAGLVDAVLYEDELAAHLSFGRRPARIEPWPAAQRKLRLPFQRRHGRAVAVVSLEGTIVPGQSRRYPIPLPIVSVVAGSETVGQALRRAEADRRIAATVFYVDSPGGDALASDLIWRELVRVGRRKPTVVYMGGVAASGGYYVSAPARHIVAQAGTVTGSIGVIGMKPGVTGLLEKAKVHTELLSRGRHAALYSPVVAWGPDARPKVREQVERIYNLFKQRVAAGRKLSLDDVERVARGRVWTGRQALECGLVDELGDFEVAVRRAKELAGLPLDREVPVVNITPPKRFVLPQPYAEGAAALDWLAPVSELLRGGAWAIMPFDLRLW